MAQIKRVNKLELIPQNPLPKVSTPNEIINMWIEYIVDSKIEAMISKLTKSIEAKDSEVILYSFSTYDLLQFYKSTYEPISTHIYSTLEYLSYKDILDFLNKSESFKALMNQLENKGYAVELSYNAFMELRKVELIVYLR